MAYLTICEMLSSAMPSRPSDATIYQWRDISWWQLATLIICVGFFNLDGSDLEGLVLDVDLVIIEHLYSKSSQ